MGNIPTENEENPVFGDIPQKDRPPKPDDPRERMGVYKALSEVPDRYQIVGYTAEFDGRDVWETWQAKRLADHDSDRFRESITRTGRRWKRHMEDRGRHHALADPEHVEAFFTWILNEKGWKPQTAYQPHFVHISEFYEWMLWHTEYPHRYNPVLMAAVEGEATGTAWDVKLGQNDKRGHHD